MNQLMQQLAAVATTDANILLTGENGTGKSQLAHWLHLNSPRAQQAFISVNFKSSLYRRLEKYDLAN